jgi:hypothetical protein
MQPSHLTDYELNQKLTELLGLSQERWYVSYLTGVQSRGFHSAAAARTYAEEHLKDYQWEGPFPYAADPLDFCGDRAHTEEQWHKIGTNKQAQFGRHLKQAVCPHWTGGLTNHDVARVSFASARQRAEALYLTLTSE